MSAMPGSSPGSTGAQHKHSIDADGLRERLPWKTEYSQQIDSAETAHEVVKQLNTEEQKAGGAKRTYGRTPDGTVFTVPHTEDMVSQLFDPTQPKNASDLAIVIVLLGMCLTYYLLPASWRVPVFAVIFIFWRLCYNAGIGWLLHNQSHHKRLVSWAKKYHIFEKPTAGDRRREFLYSFLKREMEAKIPQDYKFDEAPIEYNTWLLFRRVVDLILMSDFTSYCLFAIACGGRPPGEKLIVTIARWVGGWALILFNLWVKLDAHRVVKDFAWYWGDFFYLIDQELTFDGVFELAPHPMYSVGYAGFYGISMLAASYKVLFISIFGHLAQLTFLSLIENPHIERTYNAPPPPPKRHTDELGHKLPERPQYRSRLLSSGTVNMSAAEDEQRTASNVRHLMSMHNLDLHRVTDVAVILVQIYMYTVALLTPSNRTWQVLFVIHAIIWRLWHSIGIGIILMQQSNHKTWTRHFLKYGQSTHEAWHQWKGVYHLSSTICFTSFVCAALKMYGLPTDWTYGMSLLRHVVGFALIALQLWTLSEIYVSLGEFGWYFGDFFFDPTGQLSYGGIYRFLNNPERTIGLAGIWGAAIITWSSSIFFLALLTHVLTLCFIQFVERPHMQKLYRQSLRVTSGVSRNFQTILPSPIIKWRGSMDRVLDDGLEFLEDLVVAAKPKLASEFSTFVRNSKSLFRSFPARISITRLSPDLVGYDTKDYTLEIDDSTPEVNRADIAYGASHSVIAEALGRRDSLSKVIVEYGAPIRVRWTAPLHHSKKDWIGLYLVGDNASREITKVSSQGRWIATCKDSFDYSHADEGNIVSDRIVDGAERKDGETRDFLEGEVEFSGDKLWWSTGVFELRYHHDGRYNVMAISSPFTIQVSPISDNGNTGKISDTELLDNRVVEEALLPVVQRCFDHNPDVAPQTVTEHFGPTLEREGKYARRVVYAVSQLFGIDFAPEVVRTDGNVRNLSWRVCNAKKVLAPYSMSSKGAMTPG